LAIAADVDDIQDVDRVYTVSKEDDVIAVYETADFRPEVRPGPPNLPG